MFEASWLSVGVLTAVVFFIAYRWRKNEMEKHRKADEACNVKHTPWSQWAYYKDAAVITLVIVGSLLLLGVVRIEGIERGCSYNRYEGPDVCYDDH